jgi:hypothetical protein
MLNKIKKFKESEENLDIAVAKLEDGVKDKLSVI